MKDNRTILYNALKSEGYTDIGNSQEEFNKMLENPDNMRVAYDAMSASGYTDIGNSYEEFAAMFAQPKPQEPMSTRPSVYAATPGDYSQPTDAQKNYEERGDFEPKGQGTVKLHDRDVPVLYGKEGEFRVPSPVKLDEQQEIFRHGKPSEEEVREYRSKVESRENFVKTPQYAEGIGEGLKEGGKGLWAGVKHFAGEAANLVTGSSMDAASALQLWKEVEGAKGNINSSVEPMSELAARYHYNIAGYGPSGQVVLSAKTGKAPTAEEVAESKAIIANESAKEVIRNAIKEADGDIDKAKKMLEEKAQAKTLGDEWIESAQEDFESMRPTKGVGAWIGNLLPQMAPTAAALALSVATKNPKWAKMAGNLGMGTMTAATAGQSMKEARDAGATNGQTWAVGITDGVIELITEKIPFDKYTKGVVGGFKKKTAQQLADAVATPKGANEMEKLLREANKKLGGKLFSGENAKDYMAMVAAEGLSEFSAEALQTMTSMIYEHPDEYPTITEVLGNGLEGAKAGIFMGSFLGAGSKIASHHGHNERRKQQGYINFAETKKGDVVEVLGVDKDNNMVVVDSKGEQQLLKQDEVGDVARVTYKEFKNAEIDKQKQKKRDEYQEVRDDLQAGESMTGEELQNANLELQRTGNELMRMTGMSVDELTNMSVDDVLARIDEANEQGNMELEDLWRSYKQASSFIQGNNMAVDNAINEQTIASDAEVDAITNGDGMIVLGTTRGGEQVYIIGGNVALNGDNSVNKEGSSAQLTVVRDGKRTTMGIVELESVDAPIDAAGEKVSRRTAIEENLRRQLRIDMGEEHVFTPGEKFETLQGEVQFVADRGDGTADITVNGNATVVDMGTLNEQFNTAKQMAYNIRKAEETSQAQTVQADVPQPVNDEQVTSEVAQSALQRVPKDEQGEPIYEQVDSDTAWDAIVEQTEGDEAMAQTVADGMVSDKEAALKKLEKAKSKGGVSIAEKIAAEKERKAAIEAAKAELAKWKEIAGVAASRKAAPDINDASKTKTVATEGAKPTESVEVPAVEDVQPTNEMQPVEEHPTMAAAEEGRDTVGGSPVALAYLLEGGKGSILNAGYFLHGVAAAFPAITNEIEALRNAMSGDVLGMNPMDFATQRAEEIAAISELIEGTYGEEGLNVFSELLNNADGFYPRAGQEVAARIEALQPIEEHIGESTEMVGTVPSEAENGNENLRPITAPAEVTDVETADEFVAGLLGGIKITPESFRKETGLGINEQRKLVGIIAGEEKGGVSVERASEIIAENYAEELAASGFNGDDQDIRNMLIDILSSGNPRSYVKQSKERRAAEWVEQETARADAWASENFGFASYDDLIAYEETLIPNMIQKYAGFDEQTYFNTLAENYEYDTTRESERVGPGSEVLQGERSVPADGTESIGERKEGGEVRHDVQGGAENADAQEENLGSDLGNASQVEEETANGSTISQDSEQVSDQDAGPVNMETLQLNMSEEDFNALLNSGDKVAISDYLAEMDNALRIDENSPFAGQKALREEYKSAAQQYGKENIPAEVMADLEKRMQPYSDLSRAIYDRKYALEDKLRELESEAEKATAAKEKEIKAENKNTAFGGFLADKTDLGASTAEKALNKKYNFDGKVMTVAEFVEDAVANGDAKLSAIEEPKYKGASRAAWNRMDAKQQEEDAKKVKESGTKTVYTVNDHNLGKTAYDYAKFLLDKKAEDAKTEEVESAKIEDVGEKIGGAKKDKLRETIDRMKADMEQSDETLIDKIAKLPISKIFNFDFQKLREGGMPNEAISFMEIVKKSIPAKPRTSHKVRRWVNNTLALYKLCLEVGTNWDRVNTILTSRDFAGTDLKAQFDAYMSVGGFDSGLNIGNAKLKQLDKTAGYYKDGKFVSSEGKWYVRDAGKHGGIYDTKEEAVEALKAFAGDNAGTTESGKKKEVKFAVYQRREDKSIFIAIKGKSDIVIQDGFKSAKEAFDYIEANNAELQSRYRNLLDKTNADFEENRERKGRDYRNGKDITAEEFRTTFGFRGVEFGNWMTQEDRRKAINECYDALMDLAAVCKVSPKALSLNGTLGMAFGSRGGGKFSAHYEPGKVVINLTKTRGAGTLAHEWFHAIDNYFAKMGETEFGYATGGEGMLPKGIQKYGKRYYDRNSGRVITEEEYNEIAKEHTVRKEMVDAWEHLMESIKNSDYYKRSNAYARLQNSKYWNDPTELGARAFSVWVENELSKQDTSNDYLANNPRYVKAEVTDAQDKYMPYPFDTDADWMDEAFGNLFEVMQERETEDGNVVLFRTSDDISYENDPVSKVLGKPRFTRKLRREFAERERKRMRKAVDDVASALNTPIEVLESTEGLTGKRAKAKGWYEKSTGKIVVVLPNSRSVADVMQTVLHEAVAHYGLRKLFGSGFDNFIDNIYNNVDAETRQKINLLASRNGWNLKVATEEYLASLAEDANFERVNPSLWQRIKSFFLDMLAEAGVRLDIELSDNELRYILWRSYQNLKYPGKYRTIADEARDIAKQGELKVGNYADNGTADVNVAEESDAGMVIGKENSISLPNNFNSNENGNIRSVQQIARGARAFVERVASVVHTAGRAEKPTQEVEKIIRDFNRDKTVYARTPLQHQTLALLRVLTNNEIDDIRDALEVLSTKVKDAEQRKEYGEVLEVVKRFKNRNERGTIIRDLTGADLGEEIPLAKIDELFEMYNSDVKTAELYKRVRPFAEELGITFVFDELEQDEQGGIYTPSDNSIVYNAHMLYAPYVSQQRKASTIVHEMIHAVTVFAISAKKNNIKLSPKLEKAAQAINDIYEAVVKGNPLLTHEEYNAKTDKMEPVADYGASSAYEMISELSNPEFVEKLKQIEYDGRSVWQRIWDAIKSIFVGKNETPSVYEQLSDAFDTIVENFDREAYERTKEDGYKFFNMISDVAEQEDDILFRSDSELAIENYNKRVLESSYQMQEALQDSMLALKEAQEAIVKETGKAMRDEENAYMAENALSSVNTAEAAEYKRAFYQPLTDELAKVGKKMGYEATYDYLMAKHGIERNREMSVKEALKVKGVVDKAKYDSWRSERNDTIADAKKNGLSWEETQRKLDALAGNYGATIRDYSGLSSIYGDNFAEKAYSAVRDFENNVDTKALWARIKAANNATLMKLYNSSILDEETFAQISGMYEYYIPLRGFDEKIAEDVYAYVAQDTGRMGSVMKITRGRNSKAENPIAFIGQMAEQAITQGNRNRVKLRFLNFALSHMTSLLTVTRDVYLRREGEDWIVVTPKEAIDKLKNPTPDQIAEAVQKWQEDMNEKVKESPKDFKKVDAREGIPYKMPNKNLLSEHQVIVKRAGKMFVITVNGSPRLAQALNGLTNPDQGTGIKLIDEKANAINKINRMLSNVYTTKNINFVASNFVRDIVYTNSMVWVKESPKYAMKFHKNCLKYNPAYMMRLFSKLENGTLDMSNEDEKLFMEFYKNGGETGYTQIKDIEAKKKELKKMLAKADRKGLSGIKSDPLGKGKDGFEAIGDFLDYVNRSVENVARFAAYKTSREMGRSVSKSIWDAKEISVNFNKKGAGGKFYKANGQTLLGSIAAAVSGTGRGTYVFWNASVQGMYNIAKNAKENPTKALGMAASVFALGVLVSMFAGDDDEYMQLPEYIRRSNICFKFPWMEKDSWVTIPLPIEYRALYGAGEYLTNICTGKEEFEALKAGELISQLLPIDVLEGGGGLNAFMPTLVKPMWSAYIVNESWTGLPVWKDSPFDTENVPRYKRVYRNTSPALVSFTKKLNQISGGDEHKAGWIDINPARVEHVLEGYFGGYATMARQAINLGSGILGDEDYSFDPKDVPIASRVWKYADRERGSSGVKNKFYKYKKNHEVVKAQLKGYAKDAVDPKRTEEDRRYSAERVKEIQKSDAFKAMQVYEAFGKALDNARKMIKEDDTKENRRREAMLMEQVNKEIEKVLAE